MRKPIPMKIINRDEAARIAHILGPSCAAAAALRSLEQMGEENASKFEIVQDVKARSLILIEKQFLSDPRVEIVR